jgi:osmoprotectant transport system permease protein
MSDFTGAFSFIGHHVHLLATTTWQHVVISLAAVVIAVVIAIPIGVWLGHIHRFSFLAINISNLGRALPSLAVLSILLSLPGFGADNFTVIVALVVLAVPPMLTNAYVAVAQVEQDAVEAAVGMGMRPLEVLRRVELPLAIPLLFAGIRTATVYVIATATLGGFFGGDGLGTIISNQASYRLTGVLGASIVVAALALLAEFLLGLLQRALTPRGLRTGASSTIRPAADIT